MLRLSSVQHSQGRTVIGQLRESKTMYTASGSMKKLNSAQDVVFPIAVD